MEDGKDGTLTIGDEKIKVDEKDSAQGVFFKAANGTEYKTTRRLSVNLPSRIIARVPKEVPAGAVTVIVRTKSSGTAFERYEGNRIQTAVYCKNLSAFRQTSASSSTVGTFRAAL